MEDFSHLNMLIDKWLNEGDLHFKPVFDHCYPSLLQYAAAFIPDQLLREELAMNVLLKIWRLKEKLNNLDDFNNYFFIMMRNEVISHLRKKKHDTIPTLPDNIYNDLITQGETPISYRELLQRYQHCLQQMPPKRREVFLLSREKGLSYTEIADHLNCSVFTVQNHIAAALKFLRSHLYDYADFIPVAVITTSAMLSVC